MSKKKVNIKSYNLKTNFKSKSKGQLGKEGIVLSKHLDLRLTGVLNSVVVLSRALDNEFTTPEPQLSLC